MDKNDYDFSYLTDPNIPSSLLKLWLRELEDPLIPSVLYDQCIAVGMKMDDKSQEEICVKEANDIVALLPENNRLVVKCTVKFLKVATL